MMFCHKCGTQVVDGADFCTKCGTKVVYENTDKQPEAVPQAITEERNTYGWDSQDRNDFKNFVDNHVRATTKFQSADDLLNSNPIRFDWICFCLFALTVVGVILYAKTNISEELTGFMFLGGIFGCCAVEIASGIIRMKYRRKYKGTFEGEIDIERFLAFLDANLKTLSPYFHECGYLEKRGGWLIPSDSVSRVLKDVALVCICGSKQKSMATISIRSDNIVNQDSARKYYLVDATHRGFMLDGRLAGLLEHACLIKTAPIMQAAIEYYLKNVANETK